MQKKYRHIYFDLDRTLWDFDNNSAEALRQIYHLNDLNKYFLSPEEFTSIFIKHNERLWAQYRSGNLRKAILRSKRFELTFSEKKVSKPELAACIGEEYLKLCTEQTLLFPGTHEIMTYLKEKKYNLYLLTNGFKETQFIKLKNCDLEKYFHKIFTSETIGYNKPHKNIFHWAVSSVQAKKKECLMIGDDLDADIKGAVRYGIDQVFFNPEAIETNLKPTFEIRSLYELRNIL